MDALDRKLLNIIQAEFPLAERPYLELGGRMGASETEVIGRIAALREQGIIRLVGPVLEARKLGYKTTLVAMKIKRDALAQAETVISAHAGVSHAYAREHEFNIWFTLAARAPDMYAELEGLKQAVMPEAAISLPALRVFKIGAYFDMNGEGEEPPVPRAGLAAPVPLSTEEKVVINALQQDLPPVSAPFDGLAEQAGMPVARLLSLACSLRERGVIRRFSASINHRHAGFAANAMTCWQVAPDRVESAGKRLAELRQVSHCYERQTAPGWCYNLFAMIHGRSKEICQEIIDDISKRMSPGDHAVLYSTREFKKTRVKYQV